MPGNLQNRKLERKIPRKGIARPQSQFAHSCVLYLYIPMIDLPILLQEICGPILGIYKSLTDTWMWKLWTEATQYVNGILVEVCSISPHIRYESPTKIRVSFHAVLCYMIECGTICTVVLWAKGLCRNSEPIFAQKWVNYKCELSPIFCHHQYEGKFLFFATNTLPQIWVILVYFATKVSQSLVLCHIREPISCTLPQMWANLFFFATHCSLSFKLPVCSDLDHFQMSSRIITVLSKV